VTTALASYAFTVTPTGLAPGEMLWCVCTLDANDIAGSLGPETMELSWIDAVLASVV
jgi:hypothetical protein